MANGAISKESRIVTVIPQENYVTSLSFMVKLSGKSAFARIETSESYTGSKKILTKNAKHHYFHTLSSKCGRNYGWCGYNNI